jgi:hypothetical protein
LATVVGIAAASLQSQQPAADIDEFDSGFLKRAL